MSQPEGVEERRMFPVTVTSATKGTTTHNIYAKDAAGARKAAHAFSVAYGHPRGERWTVTVGGPT